MGLIGDIFNDYADAQLVAMKWLLITIVIAAVIGGIYSLYTNDISWFLNIFN